MALHHLKALSVETQQSGHAPRSGRDQKWEK